MIRASVNGLGQGLHGDVTTTGAVCISSLPNATQGGRRVLRLGDKTTPCPQCGEEGEIVEGFPHMKWMGVATALDGARIQCGCPTGRNRLIAPLQTSAAPPATRASNPAATNSNWVDPKAVDDTAAFPSMPNANSATCNHPDQMEELARYIAGEMNRNIFHPSVLKMKELLSYDVAQETRKQMELPWYAKIGMTNPHAIGAANSAAALALWTERVGQGRDWDHKGKIPEIIGGVWHKQGAYEYFYDIWSNIHYGYVGMAGGLSDSALLDGAGIEQIGSDTLRLITNPKRFGGPRRTEGVQGMRAWDDLPDRVAITIGMNLYGEYQNGGVTAKIIMDKVFAVPIAEWGKGVKWHACK